MREKIQSPSRVNIIPIFRSAFTTALLGADQQFAKTEITILLLVDFFLTGRLRYPSRMAEYR